ncbi:MAG TPA: AmmeMemoRadiSam system radical SAM enzyme [Candidatus Binatia bacterium]|nr:AmmeMemoRadiSam system radical SAM enzyme [Candidatus Binatia bacterium]
MDGGLHVARWWRSAERGKLLCTLCPRYCLIGEGQAGFCYIRQNHEGRLWSAGYGRSTGFAVDPIEKKPLNHFLPGARVLSFGTAGCNLGCKFCQNWDISKAKIDQHASEIASPGDVVELALRTGCAGIAYTYNDPVIWAEFVIDVAREARRAGLANVLVTAGYVTEEARGELFEHVDAANVDLKAFTEDFYHRVTFSHLDPVLRTLEWLRRETAVWTEITTLLIPGLNDREDEIAREADWIVEHLGPDVPLHFTAFHPDFKMTDRPRTPAATLARAREIARTRGVRYCYVGNVHDDEGQTTRCPSCDVALVVRDWHAIRRYRMDGDRCPDCGTAIAGRFHPGRHRGDERRTPGGRWGVTLA